MPKDLITFMHSLFLPATRTFQEKCWRPAVDVYQAVDGWLLKFDLAGVRPEDVSLQVCGSRLTIQGCRRDLLVEEGRTYYLMEIAYSHFERCIELPCNLEPARLATEYRDGWLLVHLQMEIQP